MRRRGSGEDGAGWIYADLFLALMVVGLGSAVITSSNPNPPSADAPKTFQLSCKEFAIRVPPNAKRSGTYIESEVNAEIARRGWTPDSSKPGFVILFGGFGSNESPGMGDTRAQALLPSLRSATPMLEKVEMRTGGARAVRVDGQSTTVGGAGSYLMVTYLLFSGPPLSENCTN